MPGDWIRPIPGHLGALIPLDRRLIHSYTSTRWPGWPLLRVRLKRPRHAIIHSAAPAWQRIMVRCRHVSGCSPGNAVRSLALPAPSMTSYAKAPSGATTNKPRPSFAHTEIWRVLRSRDPSLVDTLEDAPAQRPVRWGLDSGRYIGNGVRPKSFSGLRGRSQAGRRGAGRAGRRRDRRRKTLMF